MLEATVEEECSLSCLRSSTSVYSLGNASEGKVLGSEGRIGREQEQLDASG